MGSTPIHFAKLRRCRQAGLSRLILNQEIASSNLGPGTNVTHPNAKRRSDVIATHVLAVSTAAGCSRESAGERSPNAPEKRGLVLSQRGSIPPLSSMFHTRVADGEANGLQSRDSRFESAPWRHRRARQMVSRHTANVLSADARLGSIPRLSATIRVSGGYWLAAPACRAECSLGASRFESGDTHQTRSRSPIGRGGRLKIGRVWVRIPAGPPNTHFLLC